MSQRVEVDLPEDDGRHVPRRMEGGWLDNSREPCPDRFRAVMERALKVLAWLLAITLVGCVFLASSDQFRSTPPTNHDLPRGVRMT